MSSMPRILLILPHFANKRHYGKMSHVAPSLLPVSLVYLAGYLEQEHYPVRIFDGQVEPMSESTLLQTLNEFQPSMVGITCMTPMVTETHLVAQTIKKFDASLPVVVGGIHASIMPDEIMADGNIDIVVRGEGEQTFHELIQAYPGNDLDRISGLTYRQAGRIVHTPDRPLLEDLDSLPMPARHLVKYERYHQIPDAVFAKPLREILTSRGCPFKCISCSARLLSGFSTGIIRRSECSKRPTCW